MKLCCVWACADHGFKGTVKIPHFMMNLQVIVRIKADCTNTPSNVCANILAATPDNININGSKFSQLSKVFKLLTQLANCGYFYSL